MKVRDIVEVIERLAPRRFQDDWDNSGLQVGDPEAEVGRVLVCLDVTEEIVLEAAHKGCNMIVSHHPLIFHPLKSITGETYQQRCIAQCLCAGIAVYSAHTSLDNAPSGVNRVIAELLSLENLQWLNSEYQYPEGSGSGIIGDTPLPVNSEAFAEYIKETFRVKDLRTSDLKGKMVSRVAVCGGAGAFLMQKALEKGADCFITGELHYHDYFDPGIQLIELGHYQSEQFTIGLLARHLQSYGIEALPTECNTNPILYNGR